jgi:TetR/AcrR family transcriptional regulator, cholesterol catabolism regulator
MAARRSQTARAKAGAREQRRQTTAWEIREAARALFHGRGFDETTTKDIAERAGVAHGTVFLVAPTKEGLLVAALEEQLRSVVAGRMATLPKRDVVAQLAHLMGGLFAFYAEDRRLARAFLRAILFPSDAVTQAMFDEHTTAFSARLAALVEAANARGELAPRRDAAAAADAVLGLYLVCLVAFLSADGADAADLTRRFRAGLRALVGRGGRRATSARRARPTARGRA